MTERDIFIAAMQRGDPGERRAYLDAACRADAALRDRVDGLVAVYARAGSFLESPAGEGAFGGADGGGPAAGDVVAGRYQLVERVGEGGMGEVWLAEQTEPVRRKVAVKLVRPGMGSRQVVARFEAEWQALALMDHPNIATVFDAGSTESGRPYFVMELLKGVPITDYCDRHRLGPRERLGLFVDVCRAVQHAHQKGVIHRDVKPSNVLVAGHDDTPVVKVIDFGVAKVTGEPATDRPADGPYTHLVGTPLYMSPEQAGQGAPDVDTRTDVYALGVLLYELLTGTTPFEGALPRGATYAEIRRVIREEAPPKPSTRVGTLGPAAVAVSANRRSDPKALGRLLRGEPDWIVMKCLAKDRDRRYETASGLAADVGRYLRDEPVSAGPTGAGYRLRKFVWRHRGPVLAASVVLAALVAGLAGATWGLVRADWARREAETARLAEADAHRLADGERRVAEAVRRFLQVDLLRQA
ncbi:MAG TPA: serine/threonine-protein kinase, partial [Gemmataceae bacterium]